MKKQRNTFQTKQCKPIETDVNKTEISDLTGREFEANLTGRQYRVSHQNQESNVWTYREFQQRHVILKSTNHRVEEYNSWAEIFNEVFQ